MSVTTDTKKGIIKMDDAGTDEITGDFFVQFIYWYAKGATVGDDLLVTDGADNPIYPDAATETNYTRIFPINRYVSGIKLATADTGYILIIMESHYGQLSS